MTRVSRRFLTRPKKRTNNQKKKAGWLLTILFSTGGGAGKSMVGLEGKYKGNRMLFRVFVVYGDRGFTYKCIVKREGNLVLRQ